MGIFKNVLLTIQVTAKIKSESGDAWESAMENAEDFWLAVKIKTVSTFYCYPYSENLKISSWDC